MKKYSAKQQQRRMELAGRLVVEAEYARGCAAVAVEAAEMAAMSARMALDHSKRALKVLAKLGLVESGTKPATEDTSARSNEKE